VSSIGRVIDLEGSIESGVRQASCIDFKNFKIINSNEYLKDDGLFSTWLSNYTDSYSVGFWVAHNSMIEKNIISKFAPYKNNLARDFRTIKWGPWLDTLTVYKKIYPNLKNYTLRDLKFTFGLECKVEDLASSLCKRTAVKQHESMYDCIVTYLLLYRIKDQVDLKLFLC